MEYTSLYIYGIVEGRFSNSFPGIGMGDRNDDVFTVHFKDITAVVSQTPFEEYDPTEENTLAHEHVIQEVLKRGVTIAPMRFCTIVKTRNDLLKMLRPGYLSFKRNLVKIKNKHEFDVKVFLDVWKLQEATDGELLMSESRKIAAALYDILEGATEEAVLSDQVTDEMIMNASFLVRQHEREKFHSAILEFDKKYTDKIKIRISGPTAPYNFVSMPTQ